MGKNVMNNIYIKVQDKTILDSEIIQETESAKISRFDINKTCNEVNWSLLMTAANMNRKELVRYLLLTYPNININHRSYCGNTALCVCHQVSILKLLLYRKDLDVNIQNYLCDTGLHRVCRWGGEACVKEYLLDARVNVLIHNKWKDTARDIALGNKFFDIAKIINNSLHTTLLRIPNNLLLYDIVRMIIEEYV